MRLVPLAIDLLDLCELLPCIGSGTVFLGTLGVLWMLGLGI